MQSFSYQFFSVYALELGFLYEKNLCPCLHREKAFLEYCTENFWVESQQNFN